MSTGNPAKARTPVRGDPWSATQESVTADFAALGTVTSVKVLEQKIEGQTWRAALIRFATQEEAKLTSHKQTTVS